MLKPSIKATRIAVLKACKDTLVNHYKFKAVRGILYYYNDKEGIWEKAESFVRSFVNSFFESEQLMAKENDRNEVVNWLLAQYYVNPDDFKPEPQYIPLQNCVVKLPTLEEAEKRRAEINEFYKLNNMPLREGEIDVRDVETDYYRADYNFTFKHPVKFDRNAKCPKIDKFLHQVLKSEEDVKTFYELVGYCFWNGRKFLQQASIWIGRGSNGKGVASKLIEKALGKEVIVNVALQDIAEDRFATAQFYLKKVNINADLGFKVTLREMKNFKMITGNDRLSAQHKHKPRFDFTPNIVLIFLANGFPKTFDESDAFFRRWCFLEFPNQFLNEKDDKQLLEKLITPEELSGLFNEAIKGLYRLFRNQRFSNDTLTIEEKREVWLRNSNPIFAFADETLEEDSDWVIPKEDLYQHYLNYCDKKNYNKLDKNAFFRKLRIYIQFRDYRPKKNNKRICCVKGIKVLNDDSIGWHKDFEEEKLEELTKPKPKEPFQQKTLEDDKNVERN